MEKSREFAFFYFKTESNEVAKMSKLSKDQILGWILNEIEEAEGQRRIYFEEIARYIQTTSDRRDHMSWGIGDIEFDGSEQK